MIRKLTICVAFSMFCALSNAQNNMPSALDQLATQCHQVIELNDTINARQARLDELKGCLDQLKQDWLRTCNEALSSPACDDNATRINTINELIQLTDQKFEAGLLAQLKGAKNNPNIRTLVPDESTSSSPRKGNAGQRNPNQKNNSTQPKQTVQPDPKTVDDSSESDKTKKEDGKVVTSPSSKDKEKVNPEKHVPPAKKDETGNKDKTKIEESKGQENRNKTIDIVNKTKNQNK